MLLNCRNAEALVQIAQDLNWSAVAQHKFSQATLGGTIELARSAWACGETAADLAKNCISDRPHLSELFQRVGAIFAGSYQNQVSQNEMFSAPDLEIWGIANELDLESNDFNLYLQRFQRSMKTHGFNDNLSMALVYALGEMVDNVVRHSRVSKANRPTGVIGYHVGDNAMNYVVADLGRGVLRSLQGNPKWHHLQCEKAALIAAAKEGATSDVRHDSGDGFRRAIRAFTDREGVLDMRSGDGAVILTGNMNGLVAIKEDTAFTSGFRVSAYYCMSGISEELVIRH